MSKIEYFVNNVEHMEDKLKLSKKIRKVKINPRLCENKLKEFIKNIPKFDDKKNIEKFEEETGVILKYYVFYEKYSYFEYSKLGIWPDNDKKIILPDGSKTIDIKANYLEDYDFLIVDKISNMSKGENHNS